MCKIVSSVLSKVFAECILLTFSELIRFIMNFKFNSCCGCFDLRTGCLIIGYLSLIGELIIIPFSILGIIAGDSISENGLKAEEEATDLLGSLVTILSAMMLILALLYIVFTIYLLIGLHKNRRENIKAFLIFTTSFVVLSFLIWLSEFWDPPVNVSFMIGFFCAILVSIYFLLVIRSYYNKIDEQMKPLEDCCA